MPLYVSSTCADHQEVKIALHKVYFMPLHVSSTCAHHQEVKIALHNLCIITPIGVMIPPDFLMMSTCARNMYRHEINLLYHHTYRFDDTRGCVMQFWSPDDQHMCSKHVEAWNKLIVKQKFCASSWLITEISTTLGFFYVWEQLLFYVLTVSYISF